MLKQTTLMHTTTNYVNNNKPAQNKNENQTAPAHTASQPRQLAPAPLGRGAYGITFKGLFGGGGEARRISANEAERLKKEAAGLLADGKAAAAQQILQKVPMDQRSSPDDLALTADIAGSHPDKNVRATAKAIRRTVKLEPNRNRGNNNK